MQFLALLAAGLGTAFALDKWVGHETPTLFYLAVFGSFISYIYSAPPLKLKQSGWAGNYALGSSYISLPWWAGQVHTLHGEVLCSWLGGWQSWLPASGIATSIFCKPAPLSRGRSVSQMTPGDSVIGSL